MCKIVGPSLLQRILRFNMQSSERYRIHWVRYEPTLYYDDFFRVVSAEPDIELTVHYGIVAATHYPWRTKLCEGYISRCLPKGQKVDWRLLATIAKERDAFYFMAGWWTPTMVLALNLLMLLGRRFVVFTDSPEVTGRTGGKVKRWARRCWLSWVFRRAVAVLSTGSFGVRRLIQMGCPKNKATDFPNFVHLPSVEHLRCNTAKDDGLIRFFGCGRLVAEKGYDIAIRAFARVSRSVAQDSFRFMLAGTGPEEERLKALARELGVYNSVDFLGWLEPIQVSEMLSKADVFVHPAATLDPFAVSVAEAMAFGLPILGSNVCGCVVDRVENGVSGFVHKAGDHTQLGEHIAWFLSNPPDVVRMGLKAREIAEEWPISRGIKILKSLARLEYSEDETESKA